MESKANNFQQCPVIYGGGERVLANSFTWLECETFSGRTKAAWISSRHGVRKKNKTSWPKVCLHEVCNQCTQKLY